MKSDAINQAWQHQCVALGERLRYHRERMRVLGQVEQWAVGILLVFVVLSVTYFLVYGLGVPSLTLFTAVSFSAFVLAVALGRWSRHHSMLHDRLSQLEHWAEAQAITAATLTHLTMAYRQAVRRDDAPTPSGETRTPEQPQ